MRRHIKRATKAASRAVDHVTNSGGARIDKVVGRVDSLLLELQQGIEDSNVRDRALDAQIGELVAERSRLRKGREAARRLLGVIGSSR